MTPPSHSEARDRAVREKADAALEDWRRTCTLARATDPDPVDFRAGYRAGYNAILAASPKEPTPDLSDEREFTVLVCPECGEQSNFSGMDAVHGAEARCYSHGLEEVEDEHGKYMRSKPGPELVAVFVVPKSRLSTLSAENERLRGGLETLQAAALAAIDDPHAERKLFASAVADVARSALAPNTPEEG